MTGDENDLDAESVENISVQLKPIIIHEDSEALTRSSIIKEGEGYRQVWTAGDIIGVYPSSGSQIDFPIKPEYYNQSVAEFDGGGWALRTGYQYAAYYPYNYEFKDKTALPLSYIGQRQNGNNSMTHINQYNFFVSESAITASSSSLSFDVMFVGHLLRFALTMPEAGTFTRLRLKSTVPFTKTATIDISGATPVATPVKSSNKMILELENITTAADNEEITLFMWIFPKDFSAATMVAEVISSDDKVYRTTMIARNYPANAATGITRPNATYTLTYVGANTESDDEDVEGDSSVTITDPGTWQ